MGEKDPKLIGLLRFFLEKELEQSHRDTVLQGVPGEGTMISVTDAYWFGDGTE